MLHHCFCATFANFDATHVDQKQQISNIYGSLKRHRCSNFESFINELTHQRLLTVKNLRHYPCNYIHFSMQMFVSFCDWNSFIHFIKLWLAEMDKLCSANLKPFAMPHTPCIIKTKYSSIFEECSSRSHSLFLLIKSSGK